MKQNRKKRFSWLTRLFSHSHPKKLEDNEKKQIQNYLDLLFVPKPAASAGMFCGAAPLAKRSRMAEPCVLEDAEAPRELAAMPEKEEPRCNLAAMSERTEALCNLAAMPAKEESLRDLAGMLDESFSEMLVRKIDEAGMTDAQCYKKAMIDRRLFSKILSDKQYHPSKTTAIAFALSLELPLPEAEEMLLKAGFALSRSSLFDMIVRYCIQHQIFDIMKVNDALYTYDQPLI